MFKTGFGLWILVIWICLEFIVCDYDVYYDTVRHRLNKVSTSFKFSEAELPANNKVLTEGKVL